MARSTAAASIGTGIVARGSFSSSATRGVSKVSFSSSKEAGGTIGKSDIKFSSRSLAGFKYESKPLSPANDNRSKRSSSENIVPANDNRIKKFTGENVVNISSGRTRRGFGLPPAESRVIPVDFAKKQRSADALKPQSLLDSRAPGFSKPVLVVSNDTRPQPEFTLKKPEASFDHAPVKKQLERNANFAQMQKIIASAPLFNINSRPGTVRPAQPEVRKAEHLSAQVLPFNKDGALININRPDAVSVIKPEQSAPVLSPRENTAVKINIIRPNSLTANPAFSGTVQEQRKQLQTEKTVNQQNSFAQEVRTIHTRRNKEVLTRLRTLSVDIKPAQAKQPELFIPLLATYKIEDTDEKKKKKKQEKSEVPNTEKQKVDSRIEQIKKELAAIAENGNISEATPPVEQASQNIKKQEAQTGEIKLPDDVSKDEADSLATVRYQIQKLIGQEKDLAAAPLPDANEQAVKPEKEPEEEDEEQKKKPKKKGFVIDAKVKDERRKLVLKVYEALKQEDPQALVKGDDLELIPSDQHLSSIVRGTGKGDGAFAGFRLAINSRGVILSSGELDGIVLQANNSNNPITIGEKNSASKEEVQKVFAGDKEQYQQRRAVVAKFSQAA